MNTNKMDYLKAEVYIILMIVEMRSKINPHTHTRTQKK